MTTENTQDLNRLAIEAETIDNAQNADFNDQQAGAFDIAQTENQVFKPSIVKFLNFAAGAINSKIPFTTDHFNEAANDAIADQVIKVADIEGVSLKEIFGNPDSRWGAWIGLLMAVGLPSFTFYLAFKDMKTKQPVTVYPTPTDPAPKDFPTEFNA